MTTESTDSGSKDSDQKDTPVIGSLNWEDRVSAARRKRQEVLAARLEAGEEITNGLPAGGAKPWDLVDQMFPPITEADAPENLADEPDTSDVAASTEDSNKKDAVGLLALTTVVASAEKPAETELGEDRLADDEESGRPVGLLVGGALAASVAALLVAAIGPERVSTDELAAASDLPAASSPEIAEAPSVAAPQVDILPADIDADTSFAVLSNPTPPLAGSAPTVAQSGAAGVDLTQFAGFSMPVAATPFPPKFGSPSDFSAVTEGFTQPGAPTVLSDEQIAGLESSTELVLSAPSHLGNLTTDVSAISTAGLNPVLMKAPPATRISPVTSIPEAPLVNDTDIASVKPGPVAPLTSDLPRPSSVAPVQLAAFPTPQPSEDLALSARLTNLSVVMHVPSTVEQSQFSDALSALRDNGLDVNDPVRVDFNVSENQVRFFHEADAAAAEALAEQISATARDFTTFSPAPPEGKIEVWMAGNGPAVVRPAAPRAKQPAAPAANPAASLRDRLAKRMRRGDHL